MGPSYIYIQELLKSRRMSTFDRYRHEKLSGEAFALLTSSLPSGAGELTRSTVVDYKTGKAVENKARTSWGSFLTRHRSDPIVRCVAERISRWTHIPVENGEEFYLLRSVSFLHEEEQEFMNVGL